MLHKLDTVTADSAMSFVRLAGPADERAVYELMQLSYLENAILPAHNPKVMNVTKCFLWSGNRPPEDRVSPRGVVGVIGPVGGPLEAIVVVGLSGTWYSDVPSLHEWMVFVHPKHRHTDHATALHQWMRDQVQRTGLPMLTGIMAPSRMEAKCRLYRRKFKKTGEYFVHTPPYFMCEADLSTGHSSAA